MVAMEPRHGVMQGQGGQGCRKPPGRAAPKGLRHGDGIAAISAGVPLNMLRRWMGYTSIETTAINVEAIGPEEQDILSRMWDRIVSR